MIESSVTLQFEAIRVTLNPSMILHSYWGPSNYYRPRIGVYVVGPNGMFCHETPLLDTGSDFVAFDSDVAHRIGLSPPFARSSQNQGAGAGPFTLTFPDDGAVSLYVTDYRHYCYLPAPLVGFLPPPVNDFAVLGVTGFLQHFKLRIDYDERPPRIRLTVPPSFPGVAGRFSPKRSLAEQLRRLKLHSY
jgi:hypothetical protein